MTQMFPQFAPCDKRHSIVFTVCEVFSVQIIYSDFLPQIFHTLHFAPPLDKCEYFSQFKILVNFWMSVVVTGRKSVSRSYTAFKINGKLQNFRLLDFAVSAVNLAHIDFLVTSSTMSNVSYVAGYLTAILHNSSLNRGGRSEGIQHKCSSATVVVKDFLQCHKSCNEEE